MFKLQNWRAVRIELGHQNYAIRTAAATLWPRSIEPDDAQAACLRQVGLTPRSGVPLWLRTPCGKPRCEATKRFELWSGRRQQRPARSGTRANPATIRSHLPLAIFERTISIHLLLPFCSSVLVVFGLLNLQRAQLRGASTWTSMILVCWTSAGVFPALVFLGGTMQPVTLLWQPAIIGCLFLAGQLFTFLAVQRGDVSIAAPVLGIKVLIVPAIALFIVDDQLSARVWVSAAIAVIGIGFVQARDASIDRSRILASIGFALLAACSMTLFDLLIQRWASAWGAGYFLPTAFGFAAVFSLTFLPLADRPSRLRQIGATRYLAIGALLMAIQAIGMTVTLGLFGDATRVNIVYSVRGLWGVLLSWVLARAALEARAAGADRTMAMRLTGAVLIGLSVIISVT